jgi:hypothetical protein
MTQSTLDAAKLELAARGPFYFINRSCDAYTVVDRIGASVARTDSFNVASFIVESLNRGGGFLTAEIAEVDRAAAVEADQGAIDAARALSARDGGALQSEMRAARKEYLAGQFARHRSAHN